jgi:hypothetical protein
VPRSRAALIRTDDVLTILALSAASAALGLAPPPAFTGGANDCLDAEFSDSIGGVGNFSVNTLAATTGPPYGACAGMTNDVWFYWTAPQTGLATLETCGLVTADTMLAAWADDGGIPGSCPLTQLACDDDGCGLQSRVSFPVTAGSQYFLQAGGFQGARWTGSILISIGPPPIPNDRCAMPVALVGEGTFAFDLTLATTGLQGQGQSACQFSAQAGIARDGWWQWTATVTGTATLSTCGLMTNGTDTKVAVYAGTGCPSAPAIACADDTCGLLAAVSWPISAGQTYTIQLGGFPYGAPQALAGLFSIDEDCPTCTPPPMPFCFGDGSGTACPCGNAGATGNGCASSVNPAGANIASSGTPSVTNDSLVLVGSGMPNSSALYFQGVSRIAAGAGAVFGDGLRCAGGTSLRLEEVFNFGGTSQIPSVGQPPLSIGGAITPGAVRHYQVWYRNSANFCTSAVFNLSNGLSLTWVP